MSDDITLVRTDHEQAYRLLKGFADRIQVEFNLIEQYCYIGPRNPNIESDPDIIPLRFIAE